MNWLPVVGCGLLGFGMAFLLIPIVIGVAARSALGRRQEFHHTHRKPVPRFGGVALVGAFLIVEAVLFLFFEQQRARVHGRNVVVFGSVAMFALGFCDDLFRLGARRKLAGQLVIAAGVYFSGIGIESLKVPFLGELQLHAWGGVLTVLWLVGITNLLNLIDGVDGLAGGVALMLMALLLYVGVQNGTFVLATAGMTGALLAFLWFNFPPARVYLGDGGAYFLGFQIAIFAIVGSNKGTVAAALIAPLFVLGLPIVDASIAILRRGLRGLPLFRADRNHLHHRLLRTGMSRRQVVLSLYGVSLVFLVMGFVAFWSRGQLVPVLLGLALVVLLVCAGRLSFSREWFAVGRTLGNSLAMREQIQYALSMTTWLRHEARRCASLDDLYQDVVFASNRLGFTSIRISLSGVERCSSQDVRCRHLQTFKHELHGRLPGFVELQAPTCPEPRACQLGSDLVGPEECLQRANPQMYEVMADLLAEAWLQGVTRPENEVTRLRAQPCACGMAHRNCPGEGFRKEASSSLARSTLPMGKDSAPA